MSNGNNYLETVRDCLRQPECEWFEFKKEAGSNPQEAIGKYISALANGAAWKGREFAHMIWGVEDSSRKVVGTSFRPLAKKIGNDEFKFWLNRNLDPSIPFDFHELSHEEKTVVLLEVAAARSQPVRFKGTAYIRIGASQQSLSRHPEIERRLWRGFEDKSFEDEPARECASAQQALEMLNSSSFFSAIEKPQPESPPRAAEVMAQYGLLAKGRAGKWTITKMGALLYARRLSDFQALPVKRLRVITYKGNDRLNAIKDWELEEGYASGFEQIIDRITRNLPENESYVNGLRRTRLHLPEAAIRELVANAIVHRDYQGTGYGIMVEIFPNHMEISNIGESLVEPDRILDHAPRTRNEKLVKFMRRIKICEDRGIGIDKVVGAAEAEQLPAPLFVVESDCTKAVLYAQRKFREMTQEDRLRSCYLHACFMHHIKNGCLTNASLRKRLGLADEQAYKASKLINEALEKKLIFCKDKSVGNKARKYLPFWAR